MFKEHIDLLIDIEAMLKRNENDPTKIKEFRDRYHKSAVLIGETINTLRNLQERQEGRTEIINRLSRAMDDQMLAQKNAQNDQIGL